MRRVLRLNNGAEAPPQLLQGTAKFDMLLALRESGGVIRGVVEYNTDLFSTQRVQRLIGHYEQLLTRHCEQSAAALSELPLLTETEQQLLQGFNDTVRALPQDLCAHQLFEEQVARTPEAVALIAEDEQLSYAELNGRANQLAHYLRGSGVGRGNGGRRLSATRCQSDSGAAGSAQERRCLPAAGARLLSRAAGSDAGGDGRHAGAHRGQAGPESAAGSAPTGV